MQIFKSINRSPNSHLPQLFAYRMFRVQQMHLPLTAQAECDAPLPIPTMCVCMCILLHVRCKTRIHVSFRCPQGIFTMPETHKNTHEQTNANKKCIAHQQFSNSSKCRFTILIKVDIERTSMYKPQVVNEYVCMCGFRWNYPRKRVMN